MALSPGTRLAQYEILESLGSGGMGEVYRARDSRLGRDVAVKVMAPHVAADPDMRRRFETEARAIAALSHPGILSIHELAVVEGVPVAVMELLEGETLRARMRKGPMPWRDAVEIAVAIAEGLAAAHARGVVHRDLKPENVFLTSAGVVKILDFGLALQRLNAPAAASDDLTIARTAPHVVLGTLGYMSPEQVTGERVDGRTDIFALGCIVYEMVVGRPLFSGSTPQEIVARLLNDSPSTGSGVDALAPKELRPVVARCVERSLSRRFESAQDAAIAFRALSSGSTSIDAGRRPRPRGKSLGVLPFVNAGADPAIEYLIDGISESIINSLSQLGSLRVVPRSLVFRYKGLQSDPATVGLALSARTILTGRVSQQGESLSIQAELVDTTTESQLWGEQFRPKISELPNVQQEIAWQISEALRLKLTGSQKTRLQKRTAVDPAAYQEYLRGRHYFNAWSPEGFRKAHEHFQRAIDLDPTYAPAYAGLGDTIGSMSYYGFVPAAEGFPRANAAAAKAIALDPELADAHGTLALSALFWDWDWAASERHFRRSIELNPNVASVRAFHAIMLSSSCRHDEAVAEARVARQLDPLSPFVNMSVAWTLHMAERHEEVITELRRALELVQGETRAEPISLLMVSYEQMGRFEDAARAGMNSRCFEVPIDGEALLAGYRRAGARGYWEERLAEMDKVVATARPLIHVGYGVVLSQLGRLDEAVEHLQTLVDRHRGGAVFLAADPALAPLRGYPAYEELLTRVGVPRQPMASARRTTSK
jgi:serine/threonine protein kinase/Flp pilus assembly protein TadD